MKKVFNKFLSVLLAVCMSAGFVPFIAVPVSAHPGTHGTAVVYANPNNVVNKVAAQMQKRRRRITLYYNGSADSLCDRIFSMYYISTPTSHQYTLDTMKDLNYDRDWDYHKKGWCKFTLTPSYKLTDAQEAATQRKVKSILRSLHLKGSNYQKALRINDYIAKHMSYAWDPCTAYDALIRGRGCCQAYSEAFYLLALNAGIKTKMVQGNANGDGGWGLHQWNFFKSGGKWYSIDVCWNDSYGDHTWVKKGLFMKDHKTGSAWVKMVRRA